MKILIIRPWPSLLDVTKNTYNIQEVGLAKALVKRGHSTDILFWTDGDEMTVEVEAEGGKPIRVFYRHGKVLLKNVWFSGQDALFAQYDVLQTAEYNQMFSWHLAGKYPEKTVIYHGPYYSPFNKNYNRMCRVFDAFFVGRYRRRGTRFLTKSELARKFLLEKRLSPEQVTTVGVGIDAELLRDLLLFWSAKEQKMVTLQEYVEKMPAEQKYIYFAAGDSTDRLAKLPAAELVMDKGYDVLLLTEDVDEFCLQIMRTYPRKDAEGKDGTVEFKNVNSGDLGLETEDEKKAAEEANTANKALFDAMKDALDGKVKEVKVSTRLKDHPVCLSADGPLSIEMEKVLSKQPGSEGVKSDKVLELNVNHPVFAVLKAAQEAGDTDKLKKYSALLYAQAQLIEGLPVDDPAAYAEAVCSLMQ